MLSSGSRSRRCGKWTALGTDDMLPHRLSWEDFDGLARNDDGIHVITELRQAERSRRLLLLRALVDESGKVPGIPGPLPSVDSAWELLARVEEKDPAVLELMLTHPYIGSWLGYTMRLLRNRISGVFPLWVHVGHIHGLAAAAAIRARLDFHATVPVVLDGVMLPTLGFARIIPGSSYSVATIISAHGRVEVRYEDSTTVISDPYAEDASGWWGVRHLAARSKGKSLAVRLDDLDPYRGLYEPISPDRLDHAETAEWRLLFDEAWRLIVRCLPATAAIFPVGLNSLAPVSRTAPFRIQSASSGEAFGSAVIAQPRDAASLAATLVHEFQHIRLSGLLHLTKLCEEDLRERFYAPWRDDPRPIGGMLQGIYAFFGVARYWRAVTLVGPPPLAHRAGFEFVRWRDATWRAVEAVLNDPSLTAPGQRFLSGIAERLNLWRGETVRNDLARLAWLISADHYAGWRLRHVRPVPEAVARLTDAWLAGARHPPSLELNVGSSPTPVPDGPWPHVRANLTQLAVSCMTAADLDETGIGPRERAYSWTMVPGATAADGALIADQCSEAVRMYQAELAVDPGRSASWTGLGLAMSGTAAMSGATALLQKPELVRAVYRQILSATVEHPRPSELASWIGRAMS